MTHFPKFFGRCLFLILLFASCNNREERKVQRSFYYWKTVFNLTSKEKDALQQHNVQNLYVKFFDVVWDEGKSAAQPIAKSIFQEHAPPNTTITPVVFITQEPLQRLDSNKLKELAENISSMLQYMSKKDSLQLSSEIQLDCDWTATTKTQYFFLLNELKKQPFFENKTVSVTIRLHQLKFITQNGVPPVDKGLLMCYNMGNLRHPQAKNSIIDEGELKKYINNLQTYPLPLDVALPIFDWYILFEGEQYKGLVRDFNPGEERSKEQRIYFETDTVINGYSFKAGQWLRHETSDPEVVRACAERISKKLKTGEVNVILYHLDQKNLSKYNQNDLESFYRSFR